MKNVLEMSRVHFVGIFGSGMSAIAQYLALAGVKVSGSDRSFGADETQTIEKHLRKCGCEIFPQDGSGVNGNIDALCVSTAIENDNPDIAAANNANVPILHRSDVLASIVKNCKTIAVAGTSGKSTVTAMIFELLTACGKSPSLISGAALRCLEERGILGNAFRGESDILVIEADESDGTLVKYEPYASVILNLSKDHKPEEEVLQMFKQLVSQSNISFVNGDDKKLQALLQSTLQTQKVPKTFGFDDGTNYRGKIIASEALSSVIEIDGAKYTIPMPGAHNAANLLAALCVCESFGCDKNPLQNAAANFKGVDRRFNVYRTKSDIIVIDDFAHNPEKIRAAVCAAQKLSQKVIAVYQPHGFGPTRFLKNEYTQTFCEILRADDVLCFLPIYYAGGTAQKDISSQDIIDLIIANGAKFHAVAVNDKDDAIAKIKSHAQKNSCVILMGARDPSLPILAKRIANIFN